MRRNTIVCKSTSNSGDLPCLRIAEITNFSYPTSGGVEVLIENITQELTARGHYVHIFSSNSNRNGRFPVGDYSYNGILRTRFPVLLSVGEKGPVWPTFLVGLFKEKFDVIHIHGYNHLHVILAVIAAKIRRIPVVLSAHGPWFHITRPLWERLITIFYIKFVGPFLAKNSDVITCLNPLEEKTFKQYWPNAKTSLLPNSVETCFFETTSKEEAKRRLFLEKESIVVLYLGRFDKLKGLDTLLDGFQIVGKKNPNMRLLLFGRGNLYINQLMKRAHRIGVGEKITYVDDTKNVEDRRMDAYAACDIFVLPSISEPFGIVLLEAMAQGKPIVASRTGGIPYIVDNHKEGILIDPLNPIELSDALELLANSECLRREFGERGKQKAKHFTYSKMVDKLESLFFAISENK
jgi:glycosyltransferase involved in cell wall biosynthesis